ncbi:hypothetical protein D3C76_1298830 [compost metagenome]
MERILDAEAGERFSGLEPAQIALAHQLAHPVLERVDIAAVVDRLEHDGLCFVVDQGVFQVVGVLGLLQPLLEVVVMVRVDHDHLIGKAADLVQHLGGRLQFLEDARGTAHLALELLEVFAVMAGRSEVEHVMRDNGLWLEHGRQFGGGLKHAALGNLGMDVAHGQRFSPWRRLYALGGVLGRQVDE